MRDISPEIASLRDRMVEEAGRRHGIVRPCGGRRSLKECFFVWDNTAYLWYNSRDGSTHLLSASLPGPS